MNPIMEHLLTQVLSEAVGALLAALIAAVGVGGFIWRKMHTNDLQNQRMDAIMATVESLRHMLQVMSCHQLEISCERALERGCISLKQFQELQKLYDEYEAQGWNGPGKAAFDKVKTDVEIREDCD